MRRMGRLIAILLLLPLLMGAAIQPTNEFYVNDYADVLSDASEAYIVEIAKALYDKTGAQVVVATVPSLGGDAIETYSLHVARDWGIGSAEKDNGVLILLSTGDRQVRIEVGRGLEGCLPDAKTGRLLDSYAIPYYKDNDFETGTVELFKAVVDVVSTEYQVSGVLPENEQGQYAAETNDDDDGGSFFAGMLLLVALLIGLVFLVWAGIWAFRLVVLIVLFIFDLFTGGHAAAAYWKKCRKKKLWPLLWGLFRFSGSVRRGSGGGSFGGGSFGGGGRFGGGGSSRGF